MPSKKLKLKPKPNLRTHPPRVYSFDAIGTIWEIQIHSPLRDSLSLIIEKAVMMRIDEFDHIYSRFRSDSLVTHMAEQEGPYILPLDAEPLLNMYKTLYNLTGGKLSPLVGSMLSDAGYDATYSLVPKEIRPVPSWDDVLVYEHPSLRLLQPVLLDFGAAGKGYLVDIVSALLLSFGIDEFLVNAGGDIYQHTTSGISSQIGLEHPDKTDEVIGVASLQNASICGSAGNRRTWAGYTHIMDPSLRRSVTHILAVWVVAKTALLADGVATALYFVEPETLRRELDFEYAIIHEDSSLEQSPHFPAEFFTIQEEIIT